MARDVNPRNRIALLFLRTVLRLGVKKAPTSLSRTTTNVFVSIPWGFRPRRVQRKWLRQQPTTGNSNVSDQTGNSYISGTACGAIRVVLLTLILTLFLFSACSYFIHSLVTTDYAHIILILAPSLVIVSAVLVLSCGQTDWINHTGGWSLYSRDYTSAWIMRNDDYTRLSLWLNLNSSTMPMSIWHARATSTRSTRAQSISYLTWLNSFRW